ncbi:MAG: ATP-binding protein [Anaerolineae bacterium]|jgi:signal transduction histidine kinase
MIQDTQEQRMRRLERIIELSRSLNSTLSLHPLLQKIIRAARELTRTEASSIMLIDRNTGELRFEAATGERSQEVASVVVPMDGSVAGWVVRHGEPVVIDDAHSDPRFYHQIEEQIGFETRSLLALPMRTKGKVIGVLEVVNKHGDATFSEEDLETLSVLADQAAVAIENAVLFQQSDLVAEIVHELRTPLASIVGYAEMIEREDVSEEARRSFARTIQREAERLNQLTCDFLELARLESGRAFVAREQIFLEDVIEEAVNLLRPQAEKKEIALHTELSEGLPLVIGDSQRIHQALLNLVGNAVKYCRSGDRVTVTAESDEDEVTLGVVDTGPGIPRRIQDRLFEKFYRAATTESAAEGTGLGLAITREVVESHGGRIWVESEEGEGAAFYLTLPRADD